MSERLDLSRQSKLISSDKIDEINLEVFGVGSVGSHMAILLAKSGFKSIKVYDMDKVERENIGPQAFLFKHLGMQKTEAIKEMVLESSGVEIETVDGVFTKDSVIVPEPNTVYMSLFDSIEARRLIFDKIKNYPVIFLDTRIGRFDKRIYLVDCSNKEDVASYEKSLNIKARSDLECGEKASAYINYQISSLALGNLLNFIHGRTCFKIYIGNALIPDDDIYIPMKEEVEDEPT